MTTSGSPSRAWSRRGALLVLLLAPLAGAQLVPPALTTPVKAAVEEEPVGTEITLKDGRKVSGTLVEQTPERIVLSIGGIATTFKMDVVDKVQTLPSVSEQYAKVKDSIDPEDVEGLIRLAEWLRAHERYDFALVEVERALKVEPANPDGKALRTLIIEQQKIAAGGGPPNVVRHQPQANVRPGPAADFPLLTPEQINIIRVFEVDIKDPPRMRIDRATVSRFIEKYAGKAISGKGAMPTTPEGRAVFHTKKPAEILDWMFGLKAREFYGEVQVMENPKSLQMFRDHVNRTWLINSCATNNCHGGEEAGRLILYNKRQGSDQAAYTNFLILDRFRLDNGMPLITYTEPAQSPLLQMGLPQNQAVIKHPPIPSTVKGKWQPIFRGPEDEKYQQALEWIKSMYAPRPEYPVDYKAPVPHPKPVAPAGDPAPAVPGER